MAYTGTAHKTGAGGSMFPRPHPTWGGRGSMPYWQQPHTQPRVGGVAPTAAEAPRAPAFNPLYEGAYNDSVAGAGARRDTALSGIEYGENTTATDYGFAPGTDLSNPQADLSNPFSQMSLMTRLYQQQQDRTTNSYAAQGQLYSGAIDSQRGEDKFSNDQRGYQTKRGFQDRMQDFKQQRAGAQNDYNDSVSGSAWQRLQGYLGS